MRETGKTFEGWHPLLGHWGVTKSFSSYVQNWGKLKVSSESSWNKLASVTCFSTQNNH